MIQQVRRKGQAQIVVGMCALAVATSTLAHHDNDFISGVLYGLGIGLLMLGIYRIKRQ